jgi:hypothetical protein
MSNLAKVKNILIAVITALIYSLWLYVNSSYSAEKTQVRSFSGGDIMSGYIRANAVAHPSKGYTYSYVYDDSISEQDHKEFMEITDNIINSQYSWSHVFRIPIKKVDEIPKNKKYHITFTLVAREKMKKMGSPDVVRDTEGVRKYSVFFSWTYINDRRVLIDQGNWNQIDPIAELNQMNTEQYRQYVINHELGHAIGYDHENLPEKHYIVNPHNDNADVRPRCPIMYQQTRGVPKWCRPSFQITKEDGRKAIRR